MLIYHILLAIFGVGIIIVISATIIRFLNLKKKHTVNFDFCMLVYIALFVICFFTEQVINAAMDKYVWEINEKKSLT